MPRPSQSHGRSSNNKGGSILTNNPISAWLRERNNKHQQMLEEAAKEITDVKAENEMKIYQVLNDINFGRSSLPADVLDRKTNPDQPYGDLELYIMQCQDMIKNNTQDYTGIDLTPLDKGIYAIARLTQQAFDAGNPKTAFEACRALLVTIGQIRNVLPSIPEPLLKSYLENTEKYVDLWVNYLLSCVTLDQTEQNLSNLKSSIDTDTQKIEEEKDEIANKIIEDADYQKLLIEAAEKKITDSGWTDEMLELRKQLIDQQITEAVISFQMMNYNVDLRKRAKLNGMLKNMNVTLLSLPKAEDPDLLNKYNTMLNDVFKEAEKADQEFSEFVDTMNSMNAKFEQLENAPGSLKMKNMLLDQAEKLFNAAREKQAGKQTEGQSTYGSRFQLYTDEQLQKLRTRPEQKAKEVNKNSNRARNTN